MLRGLVQNTSSQIAQWLQALLFLNLFFVALHLLLLFSTPSVELATLLRFPPAVMTVALLFLVSSQHTARVQTGWYLVSSAVFTWFIADILYGLAENVFQVQLDNAAWLSIPYFTSTLIMICSLSYLDNGIRDTSERTALLLETAIIVVGSGAILWTVFLGYQVASQPFGSLIIDLLTPIIGLGLVGFVFSNLLSHRLALRTGLLLGLGTLCIAILIEGADIARAYGGYKTGHFIDVFASFAYGLFAAAGISSLLPETRSTIERHWVRFVNAIPYLVFIMTYVVFVGFFISHEHETAPKIVEIGLIIGIGLLSFLTGWRLILANQVNADLTNELLESDERLQLALRGSNDGIWDWKLLDDTVRQSPRLNAALGYPEVETIGSLRNWQKMTHPDDFERVSEEIWKHIRGENDHFSLETRYLCANQEYRWFLMRGLAVRHNGKTVRMAGSLTDITGRSGAYDSLTGLANRVLFRGYIERAMQRQSRYGDAFSVMFLDLNDFKIVNDSLGHLIGDELLLQVARRLETTVRQGDTLARLGGDEFAILAERRSKPDKTTLESISTAMLAERLIRQLELPFTVNHQQLNISGSIGIVDSNSGFTKVDDFLSAADTAMYHAKNTRSKIAFFDQDMSVRLNKRLALENALRLAIGNQELQLYYQAILETQDLKIIGFEALLRWQQANGEFITPDIFIPIAEQSGLIVELGAWVLLTACQTAMQWQNQYSVSVNVASRQFETDSFVGTVHQVLVQTGLKPHRLILEITESALLESAETNLIALRALGVRVQIDDFGTGYSSLSYLNRFPVSALKVDKSFVKDIDKNQTRAIAKAIILLAQSLGLRVVAEGVETQAQYLILKELQCNAIQGFLFAKPVPVQQLDNIFTMFP
jgi:diguanylate cyclase (GGDEF)-like protein/PAS domain S-box-containing protein